MTPAEFEEAVGYPLEETAFNCHGASIALVRSGALGQECRVARGTTPGVGGQHSWIVVGRDCYDPRARIIDPTLWSYVEEVEGIWEGIASDRPHKPHGWGSIWEWGRPARPTGPVIELEAEWSAAALGFLRQVGPLDLEGWVVLAHAPVEGWPAAEIIEAMYHHPRIRARIPIDIVGMLTDLNPGKMYLATT